MKRWLMTLGLLAAAFVSCGKQSAPTQVEEEDLLFVPVAETIIWDEGDVWVKNVVQSYEDKYFDDFLEKIDELYDEIFYQEEAVKFIFDEQKLLEDSSSGASLNERKKAYFRELEQERHNAINLLNIVCSPKPNISVSKIALSLYNTSIPTKEQKRAFYYFKELAFDTSADGTDLKDLSMEYHLKKQIALSEAALSFADSVQQNADHLILALQFLDKIKEKVGLLADDELMDKHKLAREYVLIHGSRVHSWAYFQLILKAPILEANEIYDKTRTVLISLKRKQRTLIHKYRLSIGHFNEIIIPLF